MSLDLIPGEARLYIGSIFSLRRPEALRNANITHILSTLRSPLDEAPFRGYEHCVIELDDAEYEDVMEHFDRSNAFIRRGLASGGSVLVHCAMGKSRSTTFIMAYLMSASFPGTPQNPPLTPASALALVRQARSIAEPNPSFIGQLSLYYAWGCPLPVVQNRQYRRWRFRREVSLCEASGMPPENIQYDDEAEERHQDEETIESQEKHRRADDNSAEKSQEERNPKVQDDGHERNQSNVDGGKKEAIGQEKASRTRADDSKESSNKSPHNFTKPTNQSLDTKAPAVETTFRCRRCRHILAHSLYLAEHIPASVPHLSPTAPSTKMAQVSRFSDNNIISSSSTIVDPPSTCAHIFLEPLSWMRPELEQGHLAGRFECPVSRCRTLVGKYAWQGLRCSCGVWVIPALVLSRSRVDVVPGKRVVQL